MTKEIEAYRVAQQMAEYTGRAKPKPESFGLTERDVAEDARQMDPAVARALDTMLTETGQPSRTTS